MCLIRPCPPSHSIVGLFSVLLTPSLRAERNLLSPPLQLFFRFFGCFLPAVWDDLSLRCSLLESFPSLFFFSPPSLAAFLSGAKWKNCPFLCVPLPVDSSQVHPSPFTLPSQVCFNPASLLVGTCPGLPIAPPSSPYIEPSSTSFLCLFVYPPPPPRAFAPASRRRESPGGRPRSRRFRVILSLCWRMSLQWGFSPFPVL